MDKCKKKGFRSGKVQHDETHATKDDVIHLLERVKKDMKDEIRKDFKEEMRKLQAASILSKYED